MKIRICEICNNQFETNLLYQTICNNCLKTNPSLSTDKKEQKNIEQKNTKEKDSLIDEIILSVFK